MVDLLVEPIGVRADAALARSEELRVAGLPVRVLALEDVLCSMLLARNEVYLDFVGPLRVARALREQIDWAEIRQRTAGSPYAIGFLALVEALGLLPVPASIDELERARTP
jgi:hypothetical protein